MGGICPATFQCRKQAITAHEVSNIYKLEEAASLGSTYKFQAFLEERTPKGGNGMQTLLHSLPPLLHQSLPPHPTPSLKGLHGSKGEQQQQQQQQRMQTLLQQAAMSLIRSQNQHSPPPSGPSLSQRVLGGSHVLRGAG